MTSMMLMAGMTCTSRSERVQRWLLPAAALALFLFLPPIRAVAAPLPQSPAYTVTYTYGETLWFEITGPLPTNSVEIRLTVQTSTGTYPDIRTMMFTGAEQATGGRVEVPVSEVMPAPAELITFSWAFYSTDGTKLLDSGPQTVWYEDQDVPWIWNETMVGSATIRYPNGSSVETVNRASEAVQNTLDKLPPGINSSVRLYLYPDLVTMMRALSLHQADVNGWYTTSHFPGTPVSVAVIPGSDAGYQHDIPYAVTRAALHGSGLDRWLIEGASLKMTAEDPALEAAFRSASTAGNTPNITDLCGWMPSLNGSPPAYYAASLDLYSLLDLQTERNPLTAALPYAETGCQATLEGISGLPLETEQAEWNRAQLASVRAPSNNGDSVSSALLIMVGVSILIAALFLAPQPKAEDYVEPPENTIRTRQVSNDE